MDDVCVFSLAFFNRGQRLYEWLIPTPFVGNTHETIALVHISFALFFPFPSSGGRLKSRAESPYQGLSKWDGIKQRLLI